MVWREKEQGGMGSAGGEIRAVKIVSKAHLNVREVDVLAGLQDVRILSSAFPPSPPAYEIGKKFITLTAVASGTVRRILRLVRRCEFDLPGDGVYRARRFGPLHQRVWRTREVVQQIDRVADFRRFSRPPREGYLSPGHEAAGEVPPISGSTSVRNQLEFIKQHATHLTNTCLHA